MDHASLPATAPPDRPLWSRPTGRAAVGGLLVTVSVLAVVALGAGESTAPPGRYLTAARDLPLGSILTAADVTAVAVDLPEPLSGQAVTADTAVSADIVGSVTLAPLRAGDLVERSDILAQGGDVSPPMAGEFSFAIDPSRAVNGELQAGEAVDLLATYGTGEGATTTVVARRSRVVDVVRADNTLVGEESLTLTLAVREAADILAAAHASASGALTVVRTTRSSPGGDLPDAYRPTLAPAAPSP